VGVDHFGFDFFCACISNCSGCSESIDSFYEKVIEYSCVDVTRRWVGMDGKSSGHDSVDRERADR